MKQLAAWPVRRLCTRLDFFDELAGAPVPARRGRGLRVSVLCRCEKVFDATGQRRRTVVPEEQKISQPQLLEDRKVTREGPASVQRSLGQWQPEAFCPAGEEETATSFVQKRQRLIARVFQPMQALALFPMGSNAILDLFCLPPRFSDDDQVRSSGGLLAPKELHGIKCGFMGLSGLNCANHQDRRTFEHSLQDRGRSWPDPTGGTAVPDVAAKVESPDGGNDPPSGGLQPLPNPLLHVIRNAEQLIGMLDHRLEPAGKIRATLRVKPLRVLERKQVIDDEVGRRAG